MKAAMLYCFMFVALSCYIDIIHGVDAMEGAVTAEEFMTMRETMVMLQDRLADVEEENRNQRLRISQLEEKLEINKEVTTNNKNRRAVDMDVSFFATKQIDARNLQHNQTVVFEHVITDGVNSYNPLSGTFTAPVAGTYVFSATMVAFEQESTRFGFTVNDGAALTTMFTNGSDADNDGDSQTAVLELRQMDTVTIRHLGSSGMGVSGGGMSLFSGFRIPDAQHAGTPVVG